MTRGHSSRTTSTTRWERGAQVDRLRHRCVQGAHEPACGRRVWCSLSPPRAVLAIAAVAPQDVLEIREVSREVVIKATVVLASMDSTPTVTVKAQLSQSVGEIVNMISREIAADPDQIYGLYLVGRQTWLADSRYLKDLEIDAEVRALQDRRRPRRRPRHHGDCSRRTGQLCRDRSCDRLPERCAHRPSSSTAAVTGATGSGLGPRRRRPP